MCLIARVLLRIWLPAADRVFLGIQVQIAFWERRPQANVLEGNEATIDTEISRSMEGHTCF